MKLQQGTDYLLIKKAGYYDGSRTLQQLGNMVLTRNRIILNVLQTVDVIAAIDDGQPETGNPFKDIKIASQNMKKSFQDAKESFRKTKDFGICLNILEQIASESETIEELEARAAGMGEDNPKSLDIILREVQELKFNWLGQAKLIMNNGTEFKLIISSHRKELKDFLLKYI